MPSYDPLRCPRTLTPQNDYAALRAGLGYWQSVALLQPGQFSKPLYSSPTATVYTGFLQELQQVSVPKSLKEI